MAICGLVITLEGDARQRAATLRRLAAEPGVTVDASTGEARLPAVLEAEGKAEYLARWLQLADLDGVAHLDLAYVHYDDSDSLHDGNRDSDPDKWEPGE